jgi:hypothetical protein
MSNEFIVKNGIIVQGNNITTGNMVVTGSLTVNGPAYLTSSQAITASYIDPIAITGGTTASIPNKLALRDSNGGTGFKHILFDTTSTTQPAQTGMLKWNTYEGTCDVSTDVPDVTIQIGQETILKVRNATGVTIPNGTIVYISGSIGNHVLAWPAIASSAAQLNGLVGMATSQILDNADSYVTLYGKVNGLNTSAFNEGDALYISDTVVGGMTTISPTGSSYPVRIGRVTRSHPTSGSVIVQGRQDYHTYNQRQSTIKLANGSVTASLFGTASYSIRAATASYVLNSISSSYSPLPVGVVSSSAQVDYTYITGINAVSQFAGTASYANEADFAGSASYALFSEGVDFINVVGISEDSQFAGTASHASEADGAESASYAMVAETVDYNTGVIGVSTDSQFAGTASFAMDADSVETASYAWFADAANYAVVADGVDYAAVTGISADSQFAGTASFANETSFSNTASYIIPSLNGSLANSIFHEHWISNSYIGNSGWSSITTGDGATTLISGSEVKHPGIVDLCTGVTNSGSAALSAGVNTILFDTSSSYILDCMVKIPISSSADELFQFFVGFGDNTNAGDLIDGAYFTIDGYTSQNWIVKTASNGVRTSTTTSIPIISNVWYHLTVSVNGTDTSFYINNVLAETHTDNIPYNRETGLLVKIDKYSGYAARHALVDYLNVFLPVF